MNSSKENEMLRAKVKGLEQKVSTLQIRLNEEVYLRMTLGTVLQTMLACNDQVVNQKDKQHSTTDESIKCQEQEIRVLKGVMEKVLCELKHTRGSCEDLKVSLEALVAESDSKMTKLEAALNEFHQQSDLNTSNRSSSVKDTDKKTDILNPVYSKDLQEEKVVNILLVDGKAGSNAKAFLDCIAMLLNHKSFDEAFTSNVSEFVTSRVQASSRDSFLWPKNLQVPPDRDGNILYSGDYCHCLGHYGIASGSSVHCPLAFCSGSASYCRCKCYLFPVKKNLKVRFIYYDFLPSLFSDTRQILRCPGHFHHIDGFLLITNAEAEQRSTALMNAIASKLCLYNRASKTIALIRMLDHHNDFRYVIEPIHLCSLQITFNEQNTFLVSKELFVYLSRRYYDTAAPPIYHFHKKEWKKTVRECKKMFSWIINCGEKPRDAFCITESQANRNLPHEVVFRPKDENAVYNFIYN